MKKIKDDPAFLDGMEAYLMGDWATARDAFISLEKKFPKSNHIVFILANTYYSLGNLDKAIEHYYKTIELNGDCGNAYYRLGVTYFKMGKFTEALDVFEKSNQVKGSKHVMVYYYLGLILMHLGRDEEAIDYFNKLRLASPQTKMADFFEAQLKIKKHAFQPAIELLEDFLKVSPDFAEVHFLLGEAYMGLYKNMEALSYFRKALKLNPADKRSSLKVDSLSTIDWP